MINTLPQLMNHLAAALDDLDLEAVEQAYRDTAEWVETRSETIARQNLIEAVRAAVINQL